MLPYVCLNHYNSVAGGVWAMVNVRYSGFDGKFTVETTKQSKLSIVLLGIRYSIFNGNFIRIPFYSRIGILRLKVKTVNI